MQKVVSISLNGNPFQLEEPGYNLLHAYLERAEARLEASPDRAEVMADLEQAIAEKCGGVLGPHKTVVNTIEVEKIISDMGPVESADEKAASEAAVDGTGTASTFASPPRKRLFKIREGAMWGGVCNGLAAYTNVDVTWVRIGMVVLTLFTGVMVFVYLAMLIIVPYAETAEDRAAAFGVPFSTEELITRAKKNFDEFGQQYRWHREWRRQQRHWNKQFREMNATLRVTAANATAQMTPAARGALVVLLPIVAIIGAALFVAWVLAMLSLVTQHNVFGWALPHHIPLWVGIVGLFFVYFIVSAPLNLVRNGAHRGAGHSAGWGVLHALIWIGFTVFIFWAAYTFFPGVRELVDSLMWAADLTATTISETIV